ncbi:MAG: dihydrolipoyl dehydrogenase [Planctomycetales bacterium]|nr:dihydrolipoyl dehydrogenase [Planctomycetales bacterium]
MDTKQLQHSPLVVLGGGPGGYPAAFMAADAGHDVTLVDDGAVPGGTCLRNGCIPSKALLHVARVITEAAEVSAAGVRFAKPAIDLERLRAWKDEVIASLGGGVGQLAAARSVRTVVARGALLDDHTLELTATDGQSSRLSFDQMILATGSLPVRPSSLAVESPLVMGSAEALGLPDVPERLLVVGGGYIGLEMGTVYAALGSRVTVVEMSGSLLPGVDGDLVRPLGRSLAERFESINLNTSVERLSLEDGRVSAVMVSEEHGADTECFDRVLVAVGRRPNSEGLGLEAAGVRVGAKGEVVVDAVGRTSCDHILAVGDVCGGAMLAHRATRDARRVISALGEAGPETNSPADMLVPAVAFTDPEVAWCGLTETDARGAGQKVLVSRFPWAASGRAQASGRPDGLTKLVIDPETGCVLGAGVVGVGAGELIAEAVLAISQRLTAEELAAAIHPHPTLSETICEAAEHASGRAVHMLPRRRRER